MNNNEYQVFGRKVNHALLKQQFFAPGHGKVDTTLTLVGDGGNPLSSPGDKMNSMIKTETGLLCFCKAKVGNEVFEFFIPDSNLHGVNFVKNNK
jgi:hypothetical protein